MKRETLKGVVRGRTIELDSDTPFTDGQEVEVVIRRVFSPEEQLKALEASAGILSHLPQEVFDELDEIVRDRKLGTCRALPE